MKTYRNIKTVNHMITYGMATPTLLTYLDTLPDSPNRGVVTSYDKALDILGFPQYLTDIFGLTRTSADKFTLHEIYVTIIGEFLGEDVLNNHQKSMFYGMKTNSIRAFLSKSKRYKLDKEYYNGRVLSNKEENAEMYFVCKALINTLGKIKTFKDPEEDNKNNVVIRFSDKLTTAYMHGYDSRMISIYKSQPNTPYSGHIHPYVLIKLAKFLPTITKKNLTLFNALDDSNNKPEVFEVLMLATLESMLTRNVKNIREYLEPVVQIGELISNRACIAYLVPEVPGEPEHFVVSFRYDIDTVFKADSSNIERVINLRGIYYDKDDNQLLRKEGMSVYEYLYKSAYKPKNGDYSDLRETNLTK